MCCGVNVYAVRQTLLLCGVCLLSFSWGVIISFPAVLNPAILAPDAELKATPDQASWIAAAHGLAGLVGFTVMSPIFDFFGRKIAHLVLSLFVAIGCFIYYVADDVYSLLFARLTQGLSSGGVFISIMALCECTAPKRRGYFMVLNKAALALGSLACHSLGLFLDWRQIIVFANLVPSIISIIIFIICAESPSYYAMREQFDKCAITFKWYRGDSTEAKRELKELIAAQAMNLDQKRSEKNINIFKKAKQMMLTKDFRKSFFIATLATISLDSCGRYFLLAYMTQIIVEITNDKSIAMYITVAADCIIISALFISCFTVKIFKRRTLLFNVGFCSVVLMYLVSLSIVLCKYQFLGNVKWLTPAVILLHSCTTNVGIVPIAFALTGEVFPLQQRGVGSFLSGIVFIALYALVMKVTPTMIDKTGVEGTYAIYGCCLFISLFLLRLILPETKDKTLQQIEDEMKGLVRTKADTELIYSRVNNC